MQKVTVWSGERVVWVGQAKGVQITHLDGGAVRVEIERTGGQKVQLEGAGLVVVRE